MCVSSYAWFCCDSRRVHTMCGLVTGVQMCALPISGEEIYHSFLGVPILRAGRTLGVLVVQNKTSRTYREDEVEATETTAMVIAEMIATGELKKITQPGLELDLTRAVTIEGDGYNEGIGLGHVVQIGRAHV